MTREAWLELNLVEILHEVNKALAHKVTPNGQQAGIPTFANAPMSMLLKLRHDCDAALGPSRYYEDL